MQPLFQVNFLNLEYFFNQLYQLIQVPWRVSADTAGIVNFLAQLWWWMLAISLVLLALVIYLLARLREIRQAEKFEMMNIFEEAIEDKGVRNQKWENLQKYLESDNPSEWKLAIIEADTLLDEMVTKLGYRGENLGERLKSIEPSDFLTLQDAWEAHKIRNQIAHQADYQLSKREARRVIELFARVFREFNYI